MTKYLTELLTIKTKPLILLIVPEKYTRICIVRSEFKLEKNA